MQVPLVFLGLHGQTEVRSCWSRLYHQFIRILYSQQSSLRLLHAVRSRLENCLATISRLGPDSVLSDNHNGEIRAS